MSTSTSTSTSTSAGSSSFRQKIVVDLPAKLGELPTLHFPELHLPDFHHLKQQLHKRAPSFSFKSLQHSLAVPHMAPTPSSSSSPTSPSTPVNGLRRSSSRKPSVSTYTTPSTTTSSSSGVGVSSTTNVVAGSTPGTSTSTTPAPHPVANAAEPTPTPVARSKEPKLSSSVLGHLFIQVVEARSITLVNGAAHSRPFCIIEYDQNEAVTPPALTESSSMGQSAGMMRPGQRDDIFARAMAASSPKWRYDAEFDVVRPNQQISITIYDLPAGSSHLENAEARQFLGQVKLRPSEVHNKSIDSWFRLQGRESGESVTGEVRVTIKYQALKSRHLSVDDFDILRVLGVGSFGKVYQVRKRDTGRVYAMKVLNKKQIIEQKQVEHTIAERNVLVQAIQSPFIVGLKFSFQTATKLYLVQDFMNGGELFFHMQKEGVFSEARARFYTAELVLALEHLHLGHVVYRDLKPENVLMSSQGHIVLADFGLCKENLIGSDTTSTFCGTTEYLAPEIVMGKPYGKAVDWWSLGVLLYEMLFGDSPFADKRTEGTYHKILHQPVTFPTVRTSPLVPASFDPVRDVSDDARDLIQKLLEKDPKKRLGGESSTVESVAEIKAHPFFRGIDFAKLATRNVTPPFQPPIGVMGDLDVSNFDVQFTDQKATLGMGIIGGTRDSFGSSDSVLEAAEASNFLLQQQQFAENVYRQQQQAGQTKLNPNVPMTPVAGDRKGSQLQTPLNNISNSPSSLRKLSQSSISSLNSLNDRSVNSSHQYGRFKNLPASPASPSLSSPLLSRQRTRAPAGQTSPLLQQQSQQPSSFARSAQQQYLQPPKHQGLMPSSISSSSQEFFKGFTFEGESILASMKRNDDEALSRSMKEDDENDVQGSTALFNGEATSVDSIFADP
ncbi:hypothetical protein BGW42_001657 [Actinomortierella wolfii]|nr:hypothetical protein BGW42_001657 [Actinomortierella wolfii]